MSDPISKSPAPAPQPPQPPKDDSGTPTSWNLKLLYRLTHGNQTSHGIQVVVGPTFKLSDAIKLGLGVESNFTFLYSDSDPTTLGQDDIVGEHFEGVRESVFDGSTFTDASGGTKYQNNVFGMQFIPEIQMTWRPSKDVPFEIGFRGGFIANFSTRHTEITVDGAPPGDHTGGDGCIPGDEFCDGQPIPEPDAGPSAYGPFIEDTAKWEFTGRFGPRINFPWTDWIATSAELLFVGSNKEDGGLDLLFRTGVRLTAPIHDNFQLTAEPRYVLKRASDGDNEVQHGLDVLAGGVIKW